MKTFLDNKYINSYHYHLHIRNTFSFAQFFFLNYKQPDTIINVQFNNMYLQSIQISFFFYIHFDFSKYIRSMQKLRREVEKAKRTLSYNNEALIEVENLVNFEDFVYTLTRARFEELNMVCSNFFMNK